MCAEANSEKSQLPITANHNFDINIPTIVGLALKDIFGIASELKEAESVN